MNGGTIGIVGGGQLGRMLTLAAKPLGFNVIVVDPTPDCPAAQVGAQQIVADLYDAQALEQLSTQVDFITIEIEHMDTAVLAQIEAAGTPVHPSPATVRIIQDKLRQKQLLSLGEIPIAEFVEINSEDEAATALKKFGGKMLLKTRRGAYDGRGNASVKSTKDLTIAFKQFGEAALYAEKLVPFKKELAAIIARDTKGHIKIYPIIETFHKNNICVEAIAPARITAAQAAAAHSVARRTAELLRGAGVFTIELFLTRDDQVLVNEIAPRVHNSGHLTIEACVTSQFEQHIRAAAGLPLGSTELVVPAATMVNILGERDGPVDVSGRSKVLTQPSTSLHLYGKSPTKPARKMGHITAIGQSVHEVRKRAKRALRQIRI